MKIFLNILLGISIFFLFNDIFRILFLFIIIIFARPYYNEDFWLLVWLSHSLSPFFFLISIYPLFILYQKIFQCIKQSTFMLMVTLIYTFFTWFLFYHEHVLSRNISYGLYHWLSGRFLDSIYTALIFATSITILFYIFIRQYNKYN